MRFFIIFLMIALNLTADQNWKSSTIKTYKRGDKEYNKDFGDFAKESQEIWEKHKKNIKKENLRIEMKISKEQAEIDIAKAEIQKLFLKYIEQGKFKDTTEISALFEK
nr:hypothetical protein [uncultured Campylobacter sp.]